MTLFRENPSLVRPTKMWPHSKWLFRTGLPGKSGVGGGLIAVSPGKFGIAVVSPPLDEAGNSVRAQKAIADVSNALGGNPLASKPR
jgi:glutaminase